MENKTEQLIFEKSIPGRKAYSLPNLDVPGQNLTKLIPAEALRHNLNLPELAEVDVVRHFTNLSRRNFGVDNGFYPLGSCTMKYNPKVNEEIAQLPGFTDIHPLQDESEVQGVLELLYNFEQYLCAIFGFKAFTFQPAAGAHGELTALLMIKAYHQQQSTVDCRLSTVRNKIIIPDSAHGTNPASVSLVGYQAIVVKSDKRGNIDLDELRKVVGDDTAGLMVTNPNTLGLFDEHILDVAEIIHKAGGLLYYDGANANATLGVCRPADMGFDVAHFNLHKTFATPHGCGGPGAGPVGVGEKLEPYLPVPRVIKSANSFQLSADRFPKSIGRVHSFHGNINVIVKAYAYVLALGAKGLREVSENAVLNANYVMNKLKDYYYLPYDRTCQHEFVISAKWQKEKYGVKALDIAKRLLDYGYHPPTIYFPLIVEEALMIEPTETESKETLDAFCDAMIAIAKECEENPDLVKNAPHTTHVKRLDEARAARDLKLRF
ncbi:glycine dehydrogenase (aminomethyl-transferring) [candidate division WOR-1 bacterium RIFOXYB2_FULL_42_35]|uniref:Probable glycine dehydrogenase (decarboxylating) subunit 2 n=1 Tax=candidate division WOR-1 bacterium RIFOXYC2_FULL_41_25 TaxID=1802586 RepID=A0A1F4TNN4_UNCSA|nr:MAG: glycine dehydrogenase (aminomethyl-transferring) [candidate division WOR-1 bacterium RIFOXYA2_FULL_41_14]OGC24772.1 MAG: glycine dehydrogenase (aminomethyl-transferring) [candidate division WOR-1 bacterium RIFOXYB2_FULL_42_35]OGC34331.1 MAG: glycine dehydrogenase (aminomethyl-transferring) [candidate division WOR-1 bacterium RIFOXYC2_FULL_41_25]OGC43325.1 MAG: glycine dehydrogenase (aminomethyl-transferring) [candidate division WOR-1 bacterium RIFOXYD2_FULL_41_8]